MREAQPPFKPVLKYLQEQMVLRLWTPLIGQMTNLSTRDGNCGQKRPDSSLMPWREIQRRLKFLTSIIGSMEREWDTLSHGKTTRPSSAGQHMMDELENTEGKYSSECIESYFTLFELLLAPKSTPLLAVEELHFAKQGSMTSREFHSNIVKIAKRCKFPNPEAEERAIRDAIFLGMNSQQARDKAINVMNEETKEFTVEFLMNQLAIEDCNAQHKFLSQFNSSPSMNFAAYDHRQNKGKSNKSKCTSGKNVGQNNSGAQGSSNHSKPYRKPPGMEGKCMRCGKLEHQPGQKCAAKNVKCKECHKIGHFHKVCQSRKRGRRAHLVQTAPPQTEQDTHIDDNGVRQPNPPMLNMLKIVNHIGVTKGS